MTDYTRILLVTIAVQLSISAIPAEAVPMWRDRTGAMPSSDLTDIAVTSANENIYVAARDGSIYQTTVDTQTWTLVFGSQYTGKIYKLKTHPQDPEAIWAATDRGLFFSKKLGSRWEQIFAGSGQTSAVTSVALNHSSGKRRIYAGTPAGLVIGDKDHALWNKATGPLGRLPIHDVAVHPLNSRIVFAVSINDVFRSVDRGLHWEKVFGFDQTTDEDQVETNGSIHTILFGSHDPDRVYIGTDRGLFASHTLGSDWQAISSQGLLNPNIQALITLPHSDDSIIAGTDTGVYVGDIQTGIWNEMYKGITARNIRSLAIRPGNKPVLWAATENGVFEYRLFFDEGITKPAFEVNSIQEVLAAFGHEPTIDTVQEAAVRYNEVHPDKIRYWRHRARWSSLLPQFNFGWDRDRKVEIDRGSTKDTDAFIIGPEERGFDLSMSWDIGNLIWSGEDTAIDVRSKLMVQLRDDILDEVNRIYFERRRLQTERLLSNPQDLQKQLENHLRVAELTAHLDGLTGGFFSKALDKN